MSSARDQGAGHSTTRRLTTVRILDVALVLMIAGALSVLAMQAVSGDWFPPEVSISQYGIGEHGWMLTMALLFLAGASALLLWGAHRQGAARRWSVILPWTTWIIALVVMAFVATNEWPAPLSLTGQVHQAAAIAGLFFAPIGAVLMVGLGTRDTRDTAGRPARRIVIASAALSWFFLGLLLLTNIDIDVTGLGYRRSWSLHQTIAVLLDIVMVFALIISQRTRVARGALHLKTPSSATTTSGSVPE